MGDDVKEVAKASDGPSTVGSDPQSDLGEACALLIVSRKSANGIPPRVRQSRYEFPILSPRPPSREGRRVSRVPEQRCCTAHARARGE